MPREGEAGLGQRLRWSSRREKQLGEGLSRFREGVVDKT